MEQIRFGKCLQEIPFDKIYVGMKIGFQGKCKLFTAKVVQIKKHSDYSELENDLVEEGLFFRSANLIGIEINNGPMFGLFYETKEKIYHREGYIASAKNWHYIE